MAAKKQTVKHQKRYWFTIRIGGISYKVFLTDQKHKDMEGCWGVTDVRKNTIDIEASQTPDRGVVTFIHEVLHTTMSAPSVHKVLAPLLGINESQTIDVEERLCSYLAPQLAEALHGLIYFPKAPK